MAGLLDKLARQVLNSLEPKNFTASVNTTLKEVLLLLKTKGLFVAYAKRTDTNHATAFVMVTDMESI